MRRPPAARSAASLAVGALALGGLAAGWAIGVEPRWPVLRRVTVPLPPADRSSTRPALRVLHVSDLHLATPSPRVEAFLARALDAEPDLVVATGDLLGGAAGIPAVARALGERRGVPGLVVLGSNDAYGPTPSNPLRYLRTRRERVLGPPLDTDRLVRALTERGWQVLENARTTVTTAAGPVAVAALGDPHIGRDRPMRLGPRPSAPEPGVPAPVLRLGLVHAPYQRALAALAADGAELILAGHTHGGQVRVPGVGALTTNCDLPRRQARGLSRASPEGPWLHVSAGLGVSASGPMRFACRPEATLLEVVPAAH